MCSRRMLGPAERSILSDLREHRNKWAYQRAFSDDDAYRALDSAGRLLTAVSAPICTRLANPAALTHCRNRARICPTISMRGSSRSASITRTTASRETRPRPPPRRSSNPRGGAPRLYRNRLAFLAAGRTWLQDLDEAAGRYRGLRCSQIVNVSEDSSRVFSSRPRSRSRNTR